MVVRWWAVVLVAATLACGGGGGGGPTGSDGTGNPGGGTGGDGDGYGGGGGGGGGVTVDVVTSVSAFQPVDLTVRAGRRVLWANNSIEMHTVTSDSGAWTRGSLPARGSTFGVTFNTPGDFPYHCEFHGSRGGIGMHGTIHVTP